LSIGAAFGWYSDLPAVTVALAKASAKPPAGTAAKNQKPGTEDKRCAERY